MKFLICFFITLGAYSQSLKMNGISRGKYRVGFTDTVLFDSQDWYKYGQDSIKKPLWIQIWYPTEEKHFLPVSFREYVSVQSDVLPKPWKSLFSSGVQQAILTDLFKVKRDDKGKLQISDTVMMGWNTLLKSTVSVKKDAKMAKGTFPVILYHHGAQSVPFDNHLACEHWASLGFIVASAWYNWPSEWAPDFPLVDQPIDTVYWENGVLVSDQKKTNLQDMKTVAHFMSSFPSTSKTGWVGVGHSMGAQRWLEYDFSTKPKVVERIISLHTTAESDQIEDLKNWHPNLLPLVTNGAALATTPTYLLSPKNPQWFGKKTNLSDTLDDPGFFPFRKNPTTPYVFIAGPYVDHNAFISWLPWMAYLGRQISFLVPREDVEYYEKNWNYYREVILICDNILKTSKKMESFQLPRRVTKSWAFERYRIRR